MQGVAHWRREVGRLGAVRSVLMVATIATLVAGCSGSATAQPASSETWLAKDLGQVVLIRWTSNGGSISGSINAVEGFRLDALGQPTKLSADFTGAINGESVSLTFPPGSGFSGITGTIDSQHLALTLPGSSGALDQLDFTPGSVDDYNAAVASLLSALTTSTPAPVASPTPFARPSPQTYVVVAGDTIAKIAARFGLTSEKLLAANPQIANENDIKPGDHLTIPAP